MDSTGASVVVNKKCADSAECVPQGVGCVTIDSQTVSHQVVVKTNGQPNRAVGGALVYIQQEPSEQHRSNHLARTSFGK